MNIECTICNYNTNKNINLLRHKKTKKHINNMIKNKYCMNCNKYFQTIEQYNNHMYYHNKKQKNIIDNKYNYEQNNNNINGNINQDIKQYIKQDINQDINQDKKQNINSTIIKKIDEVNNKQNLLLNENREIKKTMDKVCNKASSLINYLMKYHPSTPSLEYMELTKFKNLLDNNITNINDTDDNKDNNIDIESIINNDYTSIKLMINKFKKNELNKYLVALILKYLNHRDPTKQPVYNIDFIRNNYVVKIDESWQEDIAGIKFITNIIEPIKLYLRLYITNYRYNKIEKDKIKREKEEKIKKKKNNNEYIRYLEECNNQLIDIINFQEYVESDKFNKDILKEITPYLRYINSNSKSKSNNISLDNKINNTNQYNQSTNINKIIQDIFYNYINNNIDDSDNNSYDNLNNNIFDFDMFINSDYNPYTEGYGTSDDEFDNTYNSYAYFNHRII